MPLFDSAAALVARAAAAANSTDGNRAPAQGGVLEGANPSEYNASNPIILFIIQVHTFNKTDSYSSRHFNIY